MTYDTHKTTEPEHRTSFICDGCALTFPETDMTWRGALCYCPRCDETAQKRKPLPDSGC